MENAAAITKVIYDEMDRAPGEPRDQYLIPRIVTADEWTTVERGLKQRIAMTIRSSSKNTSPLVSKGESHS